MKRLVLATSLLAGTWALAQGQPPRKEAVKDLVKEAVSGQDAAAKPAQAPPDVEKMPFTPESIRKVVNHYQPQIQACYEETMATKEKVVEGRILTSWVITAEGMVKGAKVEKKSTTVKDPKLHECVVAVLSTMTFPKPPKNQEHPIQYPFNLKAIQ
ncbi:MAG: AgmX/PglI C-terminal domain-containing protein [Myxococcales bacterium]|nr:AgmX/PglI C-terminal domain-containing protein [Myxococcales bacterium]